MELREEGREKRMVESTILKYMTTVQVEDTTIGPESYGIMGGWEGRGKGEHWKRLN
jgi:hypothetical protein